MWRVNRREFMRGTAGATMLLTAPQLWLRTADAATREKNIGLDKRQFKDLADVAISTAKKLGAGYCDLRVARYMNESIDTREEKRDAHLRSADFFDVEKHPKLTFASKRIEKKGDHYLLVGDLTIRGVTQEIALDTEFHGTQTDPWGGERVGFTAVGKVQRKDFGLNWNVALEAGGVLVGETVDITLEIQAKKG